MFEKGVEHVDGLDGTGLTILIVHTRWNASIVQKLVSSAKSALESLNVHVLLQSLPGAYELPLATQQLLTANPSISAAISIGVLIKGSTMHFEYICGAVSDGLMRVGLDTGRPVIFGVLTCLSEEQALERAGGVDGKGHNHGDDWAKAAVEMALLVRDAKNKL